MEHTHFTSLHAAHHAALIHTEELEHINRVKKKNESKKAVFSDSSYSLKQDKKDQKLPSLNRVALPPVNDDTSDDENRDYMKELIESYCLIAKTTSENSVTQMTEFCQLQQLDVSMSRASLISADIAIKRSTDAEEQIKIAMDTEKKIEATGKALGIFNWVILGVSAAATLGESIASYAATRAATAVAEKAAEEAAIKAAEKAAEDAAEEAAEDAAEDAVREAAANDVPELEANVNRDLVGNEVEMRDIGEAPGMNQGEAQDIVNDFDAADDEVVDAMENADTKSKIPYKVLVQFVVAGGTSIPSIYQAKYRMDLADTLVTLAKIQKATGESRAQVQTNHTYLNFYQQSLERSSSIMSALGEEIGQVIESGSEILATYGQAAEGLSRRRA